jgi:hypothetical protein
VRFSLLSKNAARPPLPVISRPLFDAPPSHAFTWLVTSTASQTSAALTATPAAMAAPAPGAFVPLTVASLQALAAA